MITVARLGVVALLGCSAAAAPLDAGRVDAGRVDAGRVDAGSDAGSPFVVVSGDHLVLDGEPWFSQGANWIGGRSAPWCPFGTTGDEIVCNYFDEAYWNPAGLAGELRYLNQVLGVNTIRMGGPLGMDADGAFLPGYRERLIEFVRLAFAEGIRTHWAIFFGVPGFSCPTADGGMEPCRVEGMTDIGDAVLMPPGSADEANVLATVRTFVEAFRDEPGVLSWEVGNEILLNGTVRAPGYQEQMLSYIRRITDEIRRNDPNHFTVSGEVTVISDPADTTYPWLEGRGVEFVRFADIHNLNGGVPFSLEEVVDVIGAHMYSPPIAVPGAVAILRSSTSKPILFGEYGGGGMVGGHLALAEPVEQGINHQAILDEARAHLSGAWVWNPVPQVDLVPDTYTVESNGAGRPIVVFAGPPVHRLRVLSLGHWILHYQDNPLNHLSLTPAALALANRRVGFVSQSVPSAMHPGETRSVSVTLRNDGTTPWWSAGEPGNYLYAWRLKSAGPPDNLTWGLNTVPLPRAPILPGEEVAFEFEITAPASPGEYHFQWQLNQGAVGWFGDPTPDVLVSVQ